MGGGARRADACSGALPDTSGIGVSGEVFSLRPECVVGGLLWPESPQLFFLDHSFVITCEPADYVLSHVLEALCTCINTSPMLPTSASNILTLKAAF